jgi:hypothetical protein
VAIDKAMTKRLLRSKTCPFCRAMCCCAGADYGQQRSITVADALGLLIDQTRPRARRS